MDALSSLKSALPGDLGGQMSSIVKDAASNAQKISPSDLAKLDAPPSFQAFAPSGSSSGSFENLLGSFVGDVNQKQAAASDSVNSLLSGKSSSLHQTMISMEEASISFQLMVEVRNKLLDSYQELMKMQV
ncbi:MAG TPA: flagellar hook-basal body complex protein FliE [Verrucomicrobiae bacterium]|nr:flagellar hook-basal body complex protein FliE [Verrucomicrobiae bacterium]